MKKLRLLAAALFLLGTLAVGYVAAPAEAHGHCFRCNVFKNTCITSANGANGCTWDANGECTPVGGFCS